MARRSVFVFFVLILTVVFASRNIDVGYFRKAIKSHFLHAQDPTVKVLPMNVDFPKIFERGFRPNLEDKLYCLLCKAFADIFIWFRRDIGGIKDIMEIASTELCIVLTKQTKTFCSNMIKLNIDIFLYIIDNKHDLAGERVCAIALQKHKCRSSSLTEWTVDIPHHKPIHTPLRSSSNSLLKVLHLSDIHYDPLYTPGGNADCGQPICCQAEDGMPADPKNSCGHWGDYRHSDVPLCLVSYSLRHICKVHGSSLDFVYFTGDIISHRIWDTSMASIKRDISTIYEHLKLSFADIPIYPIFGNHDAHPVNVFVSPKNLTITSQWLFNLMAHEWKKWLPSNAIKTVRRGGYYTIRVRRRFRIIALNNNVCHTFNWWLIYDDVDPYGQLKWLIKTLSKAESKGERVHILAHIPSVEEDCLRSWRKQYKLIVERFSNIIVGQFNGHTHNDEYLLYYTKNKNKPINMAFNGGSLTTFSDRNPNYKIYHINTKNYKVMDADTWIFNLTAANQYPAKPPTWYKLYSFREAYSISNLNLNTVHKLTKKIFKRPNMFNMYYRFYHKNADSLLGTHPSEETKVKILCTMVSSVAGDKKQCKKMMGRPTYESIE